MFNLLTFILVVYGITTAIVQSKIFEPVRKVLSNIPIIGKIIKCMMCSSFWVGLVVSLTGVSVLANTVPFSYIFDSFIALATTWVIHVVVSFFEERIQSV